MSEKKEKINKISPKIYGIIYKNYSIEDDYVMALACNEVADYILENYTPNSEVESKVRQARVDVAEQVLKAPVKDDCLAVDYYRSMKNKCKEMLEQNKEIKRDE